MKWTAEPPKEPGWYWITGDVGLYKPVAPHAVLVVPAKAQWSPGGSLEFWMPFMDYTEHVDSQNLNGVLWYGPIEPPPLPK